MGSCVAYGCTNRTSKKLKNVSFHVFPSDEPRRTEWILALRRHKWMPSMSSRVCSEHFEDYMVDRSMRKAQLKQNAVPTKFPAYPLHLQKVHFDKSKFEQCGEKTKLKQDAVPTLFISPNLTPSVLVDNHGMITGAEGIESPMPNTLSNESENKNILKKADMKNDRTYCCVPQCKSQGTRNPDLSFHKFPPDASKISVELLDGTKILVPRKVEWLRALRIGKKVSSRAKVCSKHFTPGDYIFPADTSLRPRLRPTAVPSCFLPVASVGLNDNKNIKTRQSAERQAGCEKHSGDKQMIVDCETGEEFKEKDVGADDDDDDICNRHFQETDFIREASACDPETGVTSTDSLSCLEKKTDPPIFPNFDACDRSLKETGLDKMMLGEEQNTSTSPENIPPDAMSNSSVPISDRQENGKKFRGRSRERKQGPFRSIHNKEKDISENSQANCDGISSSEGIASDQNIILSINSRKGGPFKSIYNEEKDTSTDSQMDSYESSSSGNVTDLNVSSSFSSQLSPNMDTNEGKIIGSLSKPLKIEPREEVFGKLVACEMSDLCGNPELYLKTKQAILNLLVQARFDQMKQNGEIL